MASSSTYTIRQIAMSFNPELTKTRNISYAHHRAHKGSYDDGSHGSKPKTCQRNDRQEQACGSSRCSRYLGPGNSLKAFSVVLNCEMAGSVVVSKEETQHREYVKETNWRQRPHNPRETCCNNQYPNSQMLFSSVDFQRKILLSNRNRQDHGYEATVISEAR